jgi:hypothetical protein
VIDVTSIVPCAPTIRMGCERLKRTRRFFALFGIDLNLHYYRVRLLETQNRQLSGAVQRLYAYALSGQRLPALSVRVAENGQPYVHDIVAYINTLPTEPVGANDGTPGKSVARAVFSNNAEAESSFDLSPVSSLGRTESQLSYPKFFPESPRYENLEDVDLQCLWSLIDVDAPEAASLCNWLDAHNM